MSKFTRCLIATAAIALALGVSPPVAAEEPDPRSPTDLMYEDRIAERYHFRVLRHRHELYGHCEDCREDGA